MHMPSVLRIRQKVMFGPIAMAMQGLTSHDKAEKERILDQLVAADAGTHLMHESFDANDPNSYTRPWFSWAI